ncbi:hypothetical protein N374_gp088 [Bacillus phage phiNIT1]|uniref:Uncharacterized protein n=1 Tax=Bacillus phage phiNIT1 TaxID=207656 RepID=S6ATZ1_9CAUD|nr:hypothetical protein N374_gp088 [Bacillus phage phiNIT1]BAN59686.1 hypothetical protein [Bacillus phage phiNIT1]
MIFSHTHQGKSQPTDSPLESKTSELLDSHCLVSLTLAVGLLKIEFPCSLNALLP